MAYTDLIEIEHPSSAYAGETVEILVYIKNQHSSTIGVKPRAIVNGVIEVTFTVPYADIPPGYTYYFTGHFTMPDADASIRAESYYYGTDGQWHFEDYQTRTVTLVAAPEPGAASIVAKTLKYSGLSVSVPASDVPQGTNAQLSVRVRNDMSASQKLGIAMTAVNPYGTVVYTYEIMEIGETSPGGIHNFEPWDSFILSVVGTYRIRINIYVEPDRVNPVDFYDNVLCITVPQEVPTGLRSTSIDTVYGTYDPLDTVPYVLRYEYKGESQSSTLQIELGTGVAPWFTPEAVIGPVACIFAKKDEYARVTENRSFTVPDTVRRGQTYSARVTLKTDDGVSDNDIDYTALKVSDPAIPSTELRDLAITITYGEYDLGDPLPIRLSYRYQGVAQSGQASVLIGKGIIFSPVYTYAPKPVSFAHADVLTTRTEDIEVTLPMTLEPGQVYSVKVVLETSDGKTVEQTKGSAFKIVSTAVPEDPGVGQYRVVKDYAYPAAETYIGQASQVTYEFNVPMAQLDVIGDWISQKVIDEHENEVKKHGSQMLHLEVSERDHGLTSMDYLVVATATVPEETAGQEYTLQGIVSLRYIAPLGVPLLAWVAIIGVILIVLGFTVQAVIKETRTFLWGEEGEVPSGWGETVGMMIVMGLMVAMMTAMPKATEWVETGTTRLVEKGKAKIKEKVR